MVDADALVPVTVLTGFLGSGKTTLLNHILSATHGKKIAIIENEFGEVSIDDTLVQKNSQFRSDEEIVETLNGCICCSVRKDLVNLLKKLASRCAAGELCLDAIVIETTGMADPAPVAQIFLIEESVRAFARLDGIVTLVDAKHIVQHLDEAKPDGVVNEAQAQVAFADRLLLNKTDLVSAEEAACVEARLRGINQTAPIQRCKHSDVSVDRVLGIHGFDLGRALKVSPDLLNASATPTEHDTNITSVSLDQGAPRHLRKVLRGELDLDLLEDWFSELLQAQGSDIFRMKGVLAIAHAPQRYVYHAVHMTFDSYFDEEWSEGEARESKLVFIGKNLDAEALAAAFNACLATEENLRLKAEALRFRIGDTVECKTGLATWSRGTVVAHLYRNDEMPPGMVAPYQVKLIAGGEVIWPFSDCDDAIRSPRGFWARWFGGSSQRADESDDGHDHNHAPAPGDGLVVGGLSKPPLAPQTSSYLDQLLLPLVPYRTRARMRSSRRLYAQKRYEESLAQAEAAREFARAKLGEESPIYEEALFHLASTLAAMCRGGEALATLAEAAALAERIHGAESLRLVPVMHAQAEAYESVGRYDEAIGALGRARELRRSVVGPQHLDFAFSCFNQAGLIARQANDAETNSTAAKRSQLLLRAAELGVEASVAAVAAGDVEQANEFVEDLLEMVGDEDDDARQDTHGERAGPARLLRERLNLTAPDTVHAH